MNDWNYWTPTLKHILLLKHSGFGTCKLDCFQFDKLFVLRIFAMLPTKQIDFEGKKTTEEISAQLIIYNDL